MPKYIIRWNSKEGNTYNEIEAINLEAASKMAFDAWVEDAGLRPDCEVMGDSESTDKMREDYL